MSPRTGRPITGETRKDFKLQIRLNSEELERLNECAERLKKTRTDVINEGVKLVKKNLDAQKIG